MQADQEQELIAGSLSAAELALDPDSQEFKTACLAAINRANPRGLHVANDRPEDVRTESSPQQRVRQLEQQIEEFREALSDATSRESQVRTDVQTLRSELTKTKTRNDELTTALMEAMQRDNQARAQLASSLTAISDHAATTESLRQIISDRNQEIEELQLHLLQSEEARVTDAAAILDSLDKYRA